MLNIIPKSEDSSDALGVAMSVHAKPIGKFNKDSSNLFNLLIILYSFFDPALCVVF